MIDQQVIDNSLATRKVLEVRWNGDQFFAVALGAIPAKPPTYPTAGTLLLCWGAAVQLLPLDPGMDLLSEGGCHPPVTGSYFDPTTATPLEIAEVIGQVMVANGSLEIRYQKTDRKTGVTTVGTYQLHNLAPKPKVGFLCEKKGTAEVRSFKFDSILGIQLPAPL